MQSFLLFLHLLTCFGMIGLVLLQQGKGAETGVSFGATGASQTVFGSQGAANFLSRTTAIFATVFFITSLSLHQVIAARSIQESRKNSILQTTVPDNTFSDIENLPAE